MFTGLVEGQGGVLRIEKKRDKALLLIQPAFLWEERKPGESVAVNGVCLTVTLWKGNSFLADVSEETLTRSNLGKLKVGDQVNLERALRLSDRLGGHWVTGHIDGTGRIVHKEFQEWFFLLRVSFPESLRAFIVEKGSIAVNGVSLTVNEVGDKMLGLTIIPHTGALTTLVENKIGDEVNLETDLIGKYVYQFLSRLKEGDLSPKSKVNENFLREHGYL
jgi:riboflavin synthase